MLNKYYNFTLNSIFHPKAFIKKKHALQYTLNSIFRPKAYTPNSIFRPKAYTPNSIFWPKAMQCRGVTFKAKWCHKSIETSTKWWYRDYVVAIEVHGFFLIKAFGRNIELRVKLSYVLNKTYLYFGNTQLTQSKHICILEILKRLNQTYYSTDDSIKTCLYFGNTQQMTQSKQLYFGDSQIIIVFWILNRLNHNIFVFWSYSTCSTKSYLYFGDTKHTQIDHICILELLNILK